MVRAKAIPKRLNERAQLATKEPRKKKQRPYHIGALAEHEIRNWRLGIDSNESQVLASYEKISSNESQQLVIDKASFHQLVSDIGKCIKEKLRFKYAAVGTLHKISEIYLELILKDSKMCALFGKRTEIDGKDLWIARRVRGETKGDRQRF